MPKLKIIECPRDAMQSIKMFIPTEKKIKYIQSLIDVGFDTLDMGSFVSKKVIPQLQDTEDVLRSIDLSFSHTKLLVIIANIRGAEIASGFNTISSLGYPFSISENFQMRNTNKTINESITELKKIISICDKHDKEIVIYLSMGFGNPYGDPWNYEIVDKWISVLKLLGIKIISISDTIGAAKKDDVFEVFSKAIVDYPNIEFGAHFHTNPGKWYDKIDSAYRAGCLRFDCAIQGFGGCPMAKDELTGNFPTEKLISYFNSKKVELNINSLNFESAYNFASKIFIKP